MAHRTRRGRTGLTGAAFGENERHNILRPDMSQISVSDRVSLLSLTAASLTPNVEVQIKWLLGEIAKTRFEDNALQLVAYASALEKEKDGTLLALVLDLIFWNVREDMGSPFIHSRLCKIIAQEILPTVQDRRTYGSDGKPVMGADLVRCYLLDRCYREVGRAWSEKRNADNDVSASEDGDSLSVATADKSSRRWAGLARFIHAMFQESLVEEEVMHYCIERLLLPDKQTFAEASAAYNILRQANGLRMYNNRDRMDAYYVRIKELASIGDPSGPRGTYETCLNEWVNPPEHNVLSSHLRIPRLSSDSPSHLNELSTGREEMKQEPTTQHEDTKTETSASSTSIQDKLRITPTTPLSLIMDIFSLFSNVRDYTTELNMARSCSSDPVAFGGFSEIYKATLRKGTQVAVKCVKMPISRDQAVVKYTAREIDAWSKLQHKNILELLGMALFKGRLAMISSWMDQGNVITVINNTAGSVNRFNMSTQVVSAVAFLHRENVVHGDLKGTNILVAGDGTPKIADFGLAVTHEGKFQFSATDPGGGTMRWMAPELFKEHGKRSPQTDIYALGMTLLEIFTGKEPFCNIPGHLVPIIVAQERRVPERPDYLSVRSERNDLFWSLLTKCWVYEPNERAGAAELETMIQSAYV